MDRQIVYAGQLPRSLDFCQMQQNAMVGLGYLGLGVFGAPVVVVGLTASPTLPASLSLQIGPGMVSSYTVVEANAFGTSLPANPAPLLKMGTVLGTTVLNFSAPNTPGQSQCFAIYAEFSETDATPVVLPFLDTADTTQQFAGQGNDNEPLNTQRLQTVTIGTVVGAPANVGSQVVPAIPQGAIPLYDLTLTYGQNAITPASIVVAPGNPTILYTLPQIPQYFQLKLGYVPANAAGDVPGGSLTFPGTGRTVTVGTAGAGRVVAGTISLGSVQVPGTFSMVGGFSVAGSASVTGPLTVTGTTTISGLASVFNPTSSLTDGSGSANFTVGSSTGNDVVIGFNSSASYGVKMGITGPAYAGGAGVFMIGGWSDGAQYRMALDTVGNVTFRGGVNATTLLAVHGVYSQGAGAGVDRQFLFRDEKGNVTGSIIQSAANGGLYLSANGANGNALYIDTAGDVQAVGSIAAGSNLSAPGDLTIGTDANITGNMTAGGQVQGAGGVFTGGTATFGGAPGVAGQVSYNVAQKRMVLFSGVGALSVDGNGNCYTSKSYSAFGDTNVATGLAIGQVLTSTQSARELKDRLEPHGDALSVVRGLAVWDFHYTEESGFDPDVLHVGFIAQDVETAMPHAYGEVDGTPSVFMPNAVPTLWRALQQVADENDTLRADNDTLRASHDTMRATVADLVARVTAIEPAPRA